MVDFKQFMEEKETKPFRVFCDMDGCLVDFSRGIQEAFEKYKHKKESIADAEIDWTATNIESQFEKHLLAKGEKPKVAYNKARAYFWGIPHGFLSKSSIKGEGKAERIEQMKKEKSRRILDFWTNLHPMQDSEGGLALWDYLLQLKSQGIISELKILTSPSDDPECEVGKREWVRRNLKGISDEDVIVKKNKYEEVETPFDILIDDTPKKLVGDSKTNGWALEGGCPLHHKNLKSTKDQLKSILKMDESKLVMRSQKVVGKLRELSDVYVILDESSQKILGAIPAEFENSYTNDQKTFDHHITLYYKPTVDQFQKIVDAGIQDGDEIKVDVTGLFHSEVVGAQAFTVDISKDGTKIDLPDRTLHITHSLKDGVEAKMSNDMFNADDKTEKDFASVSVKGNIKFVPIK